ncbi:hypothetical protein ATO13_23806 [Stappia sp. 22II-S9-Z10]|nr:hypothetical protein ATO13_23806 [Stappia sp. 22II-S9-Z10]
MDWSTVDLNQVFGGLAFLGVNLLAYLGFKQGRAKAKVLDTEPMELAGAVIDNSQVKRLEELFEANAAATRELAGAISRKIEVQREANAAARDTTRAVEQLSRDVRDLSRDILTTARD